MEEVMDAVRRICERWAATQTVLIADAHAGDTFITVDSTRRWRPKEQFLIYNNNPQGEDAENNLYVLNVPDRHTIELGDINGNPAELKWSWPLSAGATVLKTLGGQRLQAVFFGEPDVIENLPAITVDSKDRSSDFFTLRSSNEKFDLEIGIFVSNDTQEAGDRLLQKAVEVVQYGLKRNFYPLLNEYATTTLLADAKAGDTFIKVVSANKVAPPCQMIIEDTYNIDVQVAIAQCDANTIQLALPLLSDYSMNDALVIKPFKLPWKAWPYHITFGKIYKGTLLKSAVISYSVEMMEDHIDASFGDTQLR